ncbi:hypothetical protein PULV_a3504 [Pseudoalteromonas ulvae UL12]|nr:hypothetical protein [Pseudoalteromonas ulvae UL12]
MATICGPFLYKQLCFPFINHQTTLTPFVESGSIIENVISTTLKSDV